MTSPIWSCLMASCRCFSACSNDGCRTPLIQEPARFCDENTKHRLDDMCEEGRLHACCSLELHKSTACSCLPSHFHAENLTGHTDSTGSHSLFVVSHVARHTSPPLPTHRLRCDKGPSFLLLNHPGVVEGPSIEGDSILLQSLLPRVPVANEGLIFLTGRLKKK
jgi:hypothetical protein